ncbi:MAG: hypothetical protein ACREJB_13155 [Planctomycetaceae bacterium]
MCPSLRSWTCGVWVLVLLCGCGEQFYRAETVLHSDGQIDRAIYQHRDQTPAEVESLPQWEAVTHAAEIPDAEWDGDIRALPFAPRDEQHPYFAAWGRFESADKLPDHFIKETPDGSRSGRLVRRHERVDHLLVTEHVWSETLTDVVTLEDMHRARAEFVTLAISLIEDVLKEGLGEEYDVSRLIAYLEGEGREWFAALTDTYYEAAARGRHQEEQHVRKQLAAVCDRYGLKLTDAEGQLLSNDAVQAAITAFAAQRLRELIRRKDGSAADDQTVHTVLWWLRLETVQAPDGAELPSPLDPVAQNVIVRRFGSQEEFEKHVTALLNRMLGVYQSELFGPPRRFHYTMTMPGTIVETNGRLLADDAVEWRFEAEEAYPLGYAMRCRSLEPNADAQRKLLGRVALTSRRDMLALVMLLDGREELRAALRRCIAGGDLAPLEQLRQQAEQANDAQQAAPIKRLVELLR